MGKENRELTMKSHQLPFVKNYRIIQVFHFFLCQFAKLYHQKFVHVGYIFQFIVIVIYNAIVLSYNNPIPLFSLLLQVISSFFLNLIILSRGLPILLAFSENLQTQRLEINKIANKQAAVRFMWAKTHTQKISYQNTRRRLMRQECLVVGARRGHL